MNIYCLQINVDKEAFDENALFVTFATVQAQTWKTAFKKFQKLHPEVMQRFGNGRIAIIQPSTLQK